jgi:hypothetical protein
MIDRNGTSKSSKRQISDEVALPCDQSTARLVLDHTLQGEGTTPERHFAGDEQMDICWGDEQMAIKSR